MSDAPRRERRSPMVMLLDAAMRLAISAQSGPKPRLEVPGGRRRGIGWLMLGGAGALVAAAGATVVIIALLNGTAGLSSLAPHAPTRTPVVSASAAASVTASPAASPSTRTPASSTSPAPGSKAARPPGAPAVPPTAVPLTARYAAGDGGIGLLGYAAGVTIANPGPAEHDGWRITLTLPRPTLQVAEVSGAVASQDGATWTFEPDNTTRSVPGGGSVRITFEVRGATLLTAAPRGCQIDDRPCAGVGASENASG